MVGGHAMNRISVGLVLLAVLLPPRSAPAQDRAFDFHGIKSGMTRSEVRTYLDLDSAAAKRKAEFPGLYGQKTMDDMVGLIFAGPVASEDIKRFADKQFRLVLYFTDDQRLWRLDVYFTKPDDPAKLIALGKAVAIRFKDFSVREESETSRYGTQQFYRVIMLDQSVLDPAVTRYVDQYLKKM
jgi:hypothetical protein